MPNQASTGFAFISGHEYNAIVNQFSPHVPGIDQSNHLPRIQPSTASLQYLNISDVAET
ncbi:MAG: hypothetical protein PHF31_07740 [Methylobacter sp.]|nr:hypothetical protein [Methylobacter sp.]